MTYTDSDGRECDLSVMCMREPQWAASRIATLTVNVDTARGVASAWEQLYNERNRLWRAAEDKLEAVRTLLAQNGCDCECDHGAEEHDDDCDRCLACCIGGAVER